MFILLVLVSSAISVGVAYAVVRVFEKPIDNILRRILPDDISEAWHKFMKFAIYVVGIGGGVRLQKFQEYIAANGATTPDLSFNRWTLELCWTVIGALVNLTWLLLIFFGFVLVTYGVRRVVEQKKTTSDDEPQ